MFVDTIENDMDNRNSNHKWAASTDPGVRYAKLNQVSLSTCNSLFFNSPDLQFFLQFQL